MEKNFSFKRVGSSYTSSSVLFVDRENQVMMFTGNKTSYIKSVINTVKNSPLAEEAYLDLLEIFNLYKETSEQELLEQGFVLVSYEDINGVYHITANKSSEDNGKTVLRTTPKQ